MIVRNRLLPLLAAVALMAPGAARAQFPDLNGMLSKAQSVGQTLKKSADATRAIPEPEEIALGGDLAALLLGAAPLAKDPATQTYVNRVGLWLALQTERPGLPWKFGVLDTPDVNAFSTPGGYVLITRGLYNRLRNESELAGVLAHEIAHVLARHQIRALQHSLGMTAMGEIAQTYADNTGKAASLSNASRFLNGGRELFSRGLDKEDEFEADRMGVVIAARAGYSPYGLVGVLQTLSASPTDGAFALMFHTHPTASVRLDRLAAVMGDRLDGLKDLADDTTGFHDLRYPPPPKPKPTAVPAATKSKKKPGR